MSASVDQGTDVVDFLPSYTSGRWVRLWAGGSNIAYLSLVPTDGNGRFEIYNVPNGTYVLASATSKNGPWTTEDGAYSIASNPASALAASTAIPTAGTTLTGGALGGKLTDWGGGFYNITSPANPSGAADPTFTNVSTASVAAAITAAIAAGNGMVWIPAGTFKINADLLPTGLFTMMGPGTLKAVAGVAALINFWQGGAAGNGSAFLLFTIDGNQAAGGTGEGFDMAAPTDLLIYGVTIKNTASHSINLHGTAGDARHRIESCLITDCKGFGIQIAGGIHKCRVRGNTFKNQVAAALAVIGIGTSGGAGSRDTLIEGNQMGPGLLNIAVNCGGSEGDASDGTIVANNRIFNYDDAIDFFVGSKNCLAVNNVVTRDTVGSGGGTGVYLDGDGCAAIGNRFVGLDTDAITTYGATSRKGHIVIGNYVSGTLAGVGIELGSSTAGVTHYYTICQGNIVKDGAGSNVGLRLNDGLEWATVTDNVFMNNAGGNLTDNNTKQNVVLRNNFGLNPKGNLAAPGIPTSAAVFGNPKHYDCMVYIAGGTLTAIGLGGCALPVNAAFATAGTGGTLANNTAFFYRISALNAAGETLASVETSGTTPAGANTCTVTVKWGSVAGATGYNVYGRTTGAELKMASNVQALSFLDTGSVTPSGALPGADTTANTAVGITAAAAAGSVHTLRVPAMSSIKLTYTVAPTWTWFGD